jgi:hypothetical protein
VNVSLVQGALPTLVLPHPRGMMKTPWHSCGSGILILRCSVSG